MKAISRIYESVVKRHLENERQMVFLSGPRQVGKTTLCECFQTRYLNWDKGADRDIILSGEEEVARVSGLEQACKVQPILTFDELHHYKHWKRFLKGFFDGYGKKTKILVTGSARLNVYKRGGDSLMGRYFPYRMHPFSLGEIIHTDVAETEIRAPIDSLPEEMWNHLVKFGGFPEPYARGDIMFLRRWQRLRFEQLVREDIRKDTAIREIDQIESLARILSERSGEQISYASLGAEIQMNEELKDRLVAWRTEQYKAANVRAYMVMHQRTLLEIATKIPKTKDELMAIHGFGDAKWEKYGQQILQITSGY